MATVPSDVRPCRFWLLCMTPSEQQGWPEAAVVLLDTKVRICECAQTALRKTWAESGLTGRLSLACVYSL
jgi:hypothetical protein